MDKIKPWQDDLLYWVLNLLFAAEDNKLMSHPHPNRFFSGIKNPECRLTLRLG